MKHGDMHFFGTVYLKNLAKTALKRAGSWELKKKARKENIGTHGYFDKNLGAHTNHPPRNLSSNVSEALAMSSRDCT